MKLIRTSIVSHFLLKTVIFWNVMWYIYSLVEVHQCWMYCFHLQCQRGQARNQQDCLPPTPFGFFVWLTFQYWSWRWHGPQKFLWIFTRLYGVTSHSRQCENLRSNKFSFVYSLFCVMPSIVSLIFWEVIIKGMIWLMRKLLNCFVTYLSIICYP
jgi:hypothetical protein